jgi:FKBP-type peptidyl-prolyl cis-trans isomerase
MPKKNTLRESRRAERAARRRKQRIVVGSIFGVAVIALAILAFPSLYNRASPTPEAPPAASGSQVTTASGLIYEDLVVGSGATAKAGDTVSVHYTGTLTNGSKFDSSLDRDKPLPFQLGAGEVIQGWDEGVAGMNVGGKRKLVIPPELGYGGQSVGSIPANSTLLFEVELLEIVSSAPSQ